ncbi:hypothetical protein [Protofrankia coriariae]|uniref:hypothetical protein n=1 Tax=Protofrankia coriariae TaxID=1562887 RepID=UPI000B1B1271|nr:hypothetical protein [Protofrankia coriariae]
MGAEILATVHRYRDRSVTSQDFDLDRVAARGFSGFRDKLPVEVGADTLGRCVDALAAGQRDPGRPWIGRALGDHDAPREVGDAGADNSGRMGRWPA